MAFTLPNPTLSGIIEPSELQANFDEIAGVLDGGITSQNLAAGIRFTPTNLTANRFCTNVTLTVPGGGWSTANAIVAVGGFNPPDSGDYTVKASYACIDAGSTGSPSFDLVYGTFSAGSFSALESLVTGKTVTSGTSSSGAIALSDSTISVAANRFFAIRVNTAGSGFIGALPEFLTVTLTLYRAII